MKRLRPIHVRPLEIWNAPVAGRPLCDWQLREEFPEALAELVQRLRHEHRFTRVHLLGGGALRPGLASLLGATVSTDPTFAAARAGSAQGIACADVGQTAIKLVAGESTFTRARDLSRAPLINAPTRTPNADATILNARESTLNFLAESLAPLAPLLSSSAMRPDACLLLALPCELDDACNLSSCTYAWNPGDLAALLRAAGLAHERVLVLNDAELAALAVGSDPQTQTERTLVLTLGFGVGAALWR